MRSEVVVAAAEWRTAPVGAGRGRVIPFERARGEDRAALAVAAIVAQRRCIPLARLLHRSRCEAWIAEARMLAMYLAHVVLGRTYAEVGEAFGRDRTTVAHACARIEDMRDARTFDEEVSALESEIGAAAPEELRHAAG